MRLTKRDALATLAFAAVLVPYVGYVVRGSMPFIQDARGMAATGVVGLGLALLAWGTGSRFGVALLVLGVGSIGLGVTAALIGSEGSDLLLAIFIGTIGLVWALESLDHAGLTGPPRSTSHV
jgi:hypothetical protein